jgi:hypothetical protein
MKTPPLLACLMLGIVSVGAQPPSENPTVPSGPATPKSFDKRSLSSASTSDSVINRGSTDPDAKPKIRYTVHISVSNSRQWKNTDGKSLVGKLIAFEDLTIETEKGAPPPTFQPPANPTIVKDGKARLLVDEKPCEIALDRLSQIDRDFVEGIRAAATKRSRLPKLGAGTK